MSTKNRTAKEWTAFIHGMAVALAESHRISGNSSVVCEVAKNVGLTLSVVRAAGCDPYDWKELKRAGVK